MRRILRLLHKQYMSPTCVLNFETIVVTRFVAFLLLFPMFIAILVILDREFASLRTFLKAFFNIKLRNSTGYQQKYVPTKQEKFS